MSIFSDAIANAALGKLKNHLKEGKIKGYIAQLDVNGELEIQPLDYDIETIKATARNYFEELQQCKKTRDELNEQVFALKEEIRILKKNNNGQ